MNRLLYLIFLFLLQPWVTKAQTAQPVTATVTVMPPYTTNLSDYVGFDAYRTQVLITLNDLTQPVWNTRLRVTVEGNGYKMYTRPDFRPAQPLEIFSTKINQYDGSVLEQFFNNENTIIEGGSRSEVLANNKFPEGYYNFCVEVLDYTTGKLLSNKSCAYVQMQLPNVPLINTPRCGAVISALMPQQIVFQWSPVQSISGLQTAVPEYQLTVYEVTDKNVEPLYAIQNNKALLVFTGEWQKPTGYLYTIADPALDRGKVYVFRVQARYEATDIQLKNNGYSEPCYFYYGYPTGGNIPTITPVDQYAFGQKDLQLFSWSPPDNVLANQKVAYELTVVKLLNGQEDWEAIENNLPFYTQRYTEALPPVKFEVVLPIKLDKQAAYVWKVKAYTENQLIAESKLMHFQSPALLEKFYAQNHVVEVTQSQGSINSLTGIGSVSLGNGKTQEVHFQNIQLRFVAGNYVLMDGEIIQALTDTSSIVLNPKVAQNSKAYFHPSHLRLSVDGLFLKGYVQWPFAHATTDFKPANVYTKLGWINYNDYTLIGSQALIVSNQFNLLEPFDYRLELDPLSTVSIYKNQFKVFLHGQVICPPIVNSTVVSGSKLALPFKNADQLYYFTNSGSLPAAGILPVRNLQLQVQPTVYTFDLSETRSPGKQANQTQWKGIYFDKVDLLFLKDFDRLGQMSFMNSTRYTFEPLASDSNQNYLDADGLTFRFFKRYEQGYEVKLNTFPATITDLHIDITKNVIERSGVHGKLFLPFISTQQQFSFSCPLTYMGMNPGYMTDLENHAFVFNPSKPEEKLNIKILKAVFADKEKLDMSLRIEWPFLGVTIETVTDFYAWGDYKIGFYTKDGSRFLDQQIQGRVTDYDFTVNMLGAGSGAGNYAIGFSGNVVIADDISGANGAPVLNLYSTAANSMIPAEADTWSYAGNSSTVSSTGIGNEPQTDPEAQQALVQAQLEKELQGSIENTPIIAENVSLVQYRSTDPASLNLPDSSSSAAEGQTEDIRRGLRAKLSDKEYEVLEQFINEFINIGARAITTKIEVYSTNITRKFNAGLDTTVVKAKAFITREVHNIVDTITISVARAVSRDGYDPSPMLLALADTIGDELSIEINRSLVASVNTNIRTPVTRFIKAQMVDSVNTFLTKRFKANVNNLMTGELSIEEFTETVLTDIPNFLLQSGEGIVRFVSPKNVTRMLERTTLGAIEGINLRVVGDRLTGGLLGRSGDIVATAMGNMSTIAANHLIQSVFASTPALNAVAPPSIKMNFNNLGEKLEAGRIDKIITLDPTHIAMNTKFVSFAGSLKHVKDSVYGNCWRGAFNIVVKQPKPFGVDAVFLSGKKNESEFWFCQVSPAEPGAKPGGRIDKRPKPFSSPAKIGPVEIVAGTGRVYKHMREVNRGSDIVPDPATTYGAYLNLVMFDVSNHGKTVRIGAEAEYLLSDTSGFTAEFNGNLQVLSKVVDISKADPEAIVTGDLRLYFSSVDSYFLADGEVSINKPGVLCGGGSLLLETSPSVWRLMVGDREIPVSVIPCCSGWGALGWLNVDQNNIEVGAGVGFYVLAQAGINLGPVSGGVGVDAGVELKAWAQVQYKPEFVFNQIGVDARGWVHIYVYYSVRGASGSLDLVDVEIGLQGIVYINPKPSAVDGRVRGHIKVLAWGIDFEAGFRKTV